LAQFSTGWRFPAALNVSNTPGKLLGRRRLAAATGVGTTISVNRPNDHTAVVTTKRNGEIRSTSTRTVSSDGKRLTEVTEAKGVAGPIRNTRVYDRVGSAPGGDALLGTWREDIAKRKSDPRPILMIKVDGDQVDLTTAARHIFTAKLDDKEHKRDDVDSTVRLKRIDANTVEIILNSPTVPPATRRMQAKGNTLVVTTTGTGPGGKPYNDVAFYERQN
jgi:hypothetical protein